MTAPAEEAAPAGRGAELRPVGGVRIHYRAWTPHRPRAGLLVVHGLGEHSGRYASLAAELSRRGIAVFAPDLRGHGLSGGRRGHVRSFEDYLEEVDAMRAEAVRALSGETPLLLMGHSLGGLVAIRFLQTRPETVFRGVVLSAPALGLARKVSAVERTLARVLDRLLPAVPLPNGIPPEDLSHDPAEVEAYRSDPLVHRWITPRLFTQMEDAMRAALAGAGAIADPALVLVPEADRVVSPEAALDFCRRADLPARRLPGCFHEPLHEVRRAEIAREVADWLEARIA
jgi:lysophospholipase